MGTLNVSQVAVNPELVGTVKMSLVSDLPTGFHINPLKRSNRVNVRLREEDASFLETMALEAGMPLHAFLADIIHQNAAAKKT